MKYCSVVFDFINEACHQALNRRSGLMVSLGQPIEYFRTTRRAGAAVEFALSGFALLAFILAILNLGLLGFSLGALTHGVQATARKAAVFAANQYATTGTMTCPDNPTVAGYFNSFAQPPLPSAGTATGSNPLITATWTNNSAGDGSNEWTGVYLTLTVKYTWVPVGFPAFGQGIPLSITTASTVMGSSNISASISSSCGSPS